MKAFKSHPKSRVIIKSICRALVIISLKLYRESGKRYIYDKVILRPSHSVAAGIGVLGESPAAATF